MAWYHTFFEGVPQRAWKLGQSEEQTEFESEFLWDVLELEEGNAVLDVFSGYGRHAIQLAAKGAKLWCIDISREYCEELTIISREENLGIQVLCADFLEAALPPQKMDAAYCMGNSLSFFDRDDMKLFFSRISESLRTGGRLVLQTSMLAESIFPVFQDNAWMEVGEGEERIYYLVQNEYDPLAGVIHANITYVEKGETSKYQIEQHLYTLAELVEIARAAGLSAGEVFSAIDGEPYRLGDEDAFILLTKE